MVAVASQKIISESTVLPCHRLRSQPLIVLDGTATKCRVFFSTRYYWLIDDYLREPSVIDSFFYYDDDYWPRGRNHPEVTPKSRDCQLFWMRGTFLTATTHHEQQSNSGTAAVEVAAVAAAAADQADQAIRALCARLQVPKRRSSARTSTHSLQQRHSQSSRLQEEGRPCYYYL